MPKLYKNSMGGRVIDCDNCDKETAFSYMICAECNGIYYQCSNCKLENKKVSEDENTTFRKPCNFH